MQIDCTPKEQKLLKIISKAAQQLGVPCFVIGGFVRDKILQRATKDIDIVCLGNGIELAQATAQLLNPQPEVHFFKNFGTAHINVNDMEVEFVGARKESYSENSRKPAVTNGTLVDDLNRRDLTINALAVSLNKEDYGTLLDSFDGLHHLQQKRITTPLHPDKTFSDDPLRMMRAIRFAAQLQFTIDEAILTSITQNAHRLSIVSQERITDEFNKIMLCKKPSIGLDLLSKTGILSIIFPQAMALHGAEYLDGKGHKDNFYHTLQVLDNICVHTKDLWLRWAALLHDIGKPPTKRFEEGHGWTFHGHEVVGAKMTPKIFNQFKLPMGEPMRFVQQMVLLHLRPISLTKENITDSAIRRLLFDAGQHLESLFLLCNADITSKNKYKVQRYLQNFEMVKKRCEEVESKDAMRNWQPPIKGEYIMQVFGIPPSKPVGHLKDAIKDAILDGVIPNSFDHAYQYMLHLAENMGLTPVNTQKPL